MKILIDECADRLEKSLTNCADNEIDVRQVMVNYTMDVIAICAFATKIDTYNSGGEEQHPFLKNAQVFFKPSMRFGSYFLLNALMPSLVKKYNLCFVSRDVINYFKSAVNSIRISIYF